METISQMASSAMKATFGETKNEPLSGAQGDVSRGEPYDAGNLGAPFYPSPAIAIFPSI